MTRTVAALALLTLLGVIGAWATWAMYDLATIYGDPTRSELSTFGPFGGIVAVVVATMAGIAVMAGVTARGQLRAVVRVVGGALVALTVTGLVVGNHLGVQAKQVETSEPPGCGIANGRLDQQFRSLDHPGYFGGGTSSRTHCSYLLATNDLPTALVDYEEQLRGLGWQVSVSTQALTASGAEYRFSAAVEAPPHGDPYLEVALREVSCPRPEAAPPRPGG